MKTKEFNFEEAYAQILKDAEEAGLADDVVFRTTVKEFKRMKDLCDKIYDGIDDVSLEGVGSKGQTVFKSNPLIKDYVSAHKALIGTCTELRKMLEAFNKPQQTDEDDWL